MSVEITPQILDQIRDRLVLSDIIGKNVKLTRKGSESSGLCPFHQEKSPSFTVNDQKGFYHCFGCGAHGDAFEYFMQMQNATFPEAVEHCANIAGIALPQQDPRVKEKQDAMDPLFKASEAAAAWFESQLKEPAGREALSYLQGRGLSPKTIASFRLGFAPQGGNKLTEHLSKLGYPTKVLLTAGLVSESVERKEIYDRFRGRIMYPITDHKGRVIAFGARAMGDAQPKYLNSPETPIFNKGETLYGLDGLKAHFKDREAVVVEGYMDVIALAQTGLYAPVAPLGTALTEAHMQKVWRFRKEPIVSFDGDAAGQRAANRTVERALPHLKPGYSLRFATLPKGEDPDSMILNGALKDLQAVYNRPKALVDVLWQKELEKSTVDTPEKMADFRTRLFAELERIEDKITKECYRDHIFAKIGDLRASLFQKRTNSQKTRAPSPQVSATREKFDPMLVQHKILLVTLVNHPHLLYEVIEQFVDLDLAGDLDCVRQALVDLASESDSLTADQTWATLQNNGLQDIVKMYLNQVYLHASFVNKNASLEDARSGWNHIWQRLQESQSYKRQVVEAQRELEDNITEVSWKRYKHLRETAIQTPDEDTEQTG